MSPTSLSTSSSPGRYGGGDESGGEELDPGPSSSSRSRMKAAANGVWPEPFVEAVAFQVAIDASRNTSRLAVGAALANMFQVCSTWRAVSRSDLLWQSLTSRVWNRRRSRRSNTWRDEYIYWHQTAHNFRTGSYIYTNLRFAPPPNNGDSALSCRLLALSDHHLAAGFSNGSVLLFHIPTRFHVSTFRPHYRDRLGWFSSAVSGIVLSDTRLVFASLDGDIHVAIIGDAGTTRRAHLGDVVNDGALVDFTGCDRWWVGLYAGVPGRAIHIWDGESEDLIFVGGTLTDPEAVTGWHLLTESTEPVGRVRITSHESAAAACTSRRLIVFDLRNPGLIIGEQEFPGGLAVGSFDAANDSYLIADGLGVASVRRAEDLGETCRLRNVRANVNVLACMNCGYVLMCAGGVIRVWEIENSGRYVYSIRERVGDLHALVADDRHVAAACTNDSIIHLWDFGAQYH